MGSARRLLLVATLVLAIAADARTDATLSTLTLSPDAGSLITTRDDSTSTSTTTSTTTSTDTSTGVIGSAASDRNTVTKAPATETPETETPATTAPPSSDSGTTSTSGSGEQETTEVPSSASATVSPGSDSDRSSTESQSEASTSKSSTANVDTLNDTNGTISAGNSTTSMGTVLPVVFGALACVGAIVMAVTYKKKRDANYASEDNRPSTDCEYASGADFTPDNRTLSTVQEDAPVRVPVLSTQSNAGLSASGAIADFTGPNSSVCSSSPFGSAHSKVRVSSPVQNGYSSSDTNMEFQDTAPRHGGGSNVVLTIEELRTDSTHTGPQVQM